MTLGIYIHVPFCGKKCGYCDFYSVGYSKNLTKLYTDAVIRNIKHYSDKSMITDTVYFGGGNPSLLSAEQIRNIINQIRDDFILAENAEITLESNPLALNPEKLQSLRNIGINRLSIGVQSMNDDELKFLGRSHNAQQAEKAVICAHDAGFENISCDLMTAIPKQDLKSLEYSIEKLSALPVNHISSYILKIEENTPFYRNNISALLPDEEKTADFYLETVRLLEKHGFHQYEISNFAKKGFESRHNCRYWKCMDYIGIGSSAHSCYKDRRFSVCRDIDKFIKSEIQPVEITDENPCGFEEYAMLRLRLSEGLDLREFPEKKNIIEKKIPPLINSGYAVYDGNIISLTPKGFLMSNSVISYLIF